MTAQPVSSLKLFLSFVTNEEDLNKKTSGGGHPNCAQKILSRECFEAWLASRESPPKHPRASFRRTLICHIRGTDGRRPFPEHIETELLKLLRNNVDSDGTCIWDKVFGQNEDNVGKRLFKQCGYHELKKKEAEGIKSNMVYQNKASPKLKEYDIPKKRSFDHIQDALSQHQSNKKHGDDSGNETDRLGTPFRPTNTPLSAANLMKLSSLASGMSLPFQIDGSRENFGSAQSGPFAGDASPSDLSSLNIQMLLAECQKFNPGHSANALSDVIEGLRNHSTAESLDKVFMNTLRSRRDAMADDELFNLLRAYPISKNPLYTRDFVIDRHSTFLPGIVVGRLVVDRYSHRLVDLDENCRHIMRAIPLGQYIPTYLPSIKHYLYVFSEVIINGLDAPEGFCARLILYSSSGHPAIFQSKFVKVPNCSLFEVFIQDQTFRFPHLLPLLDLELRLAKV